MAKRLKGVTSQGPRGRRGERGETGKTGAPGPPGPPGRYVSREEVFTMLADQFADLRQELSVQMTRMGQIQAQLDHTEAMLTKLLEADRPPRAKQR